MTELHDLSPPRGSHRNRKRLGRGPGTGQGKTAGKGHKGQLARTGGKVRRGFEGGQMPLQRRIPKGGFTPLDRAEHQVVNVRALEALEEDEITLDVLKARGLVRSLSKSVKVLGTGDLTRALKVSAHAFSASAREKIEGAGGTVTLIER
ncbi:MAG: 50S ribosomal protein L15 [Gemmatimonadetes bacterium]|nr:50S ribosomal protein L15 [Gemmatimonadota bacterium]